MKLTLFDWSVVGGYFAINLLIGLWYRKRATGSTEDYFVSGRNASWWLDGCLMVYLTLFGAGKIIFGYRGAGLMFLGAAAAAGIYLYWHLSRRGWNVLAGESPGNPRMPMSKGD